MPVESPLLREELRFMLDSHDSDQRYAWQMQADGTYIQRSPGVNEQPDGLHQRLIARTTQAVREAQRLKRRVARTSA